MNGGWESGIGPISDVIGMNYNTWAYDRIHARFPTIPLYASETASAVSTRGIYANDRERGYVSAYDVNFPPWADTAEDAWRQVVARPWMAGAFIWTGFDYKGEPTPYGWPCINSHFGIVDICGFPKDDYYWYQAWWRARPVVHVLPHWNWAGREGQPITVWVYGNTGRVELLLNGRSLGTKPMPALGHLEWQVPYAPGRLEARGTTNGRLLATDVDETTGPPAAIRLVAMDRTRLLADAEDCVPIAAQIVDSHGRIVPTADNPVVFTIRGSAAIAGVGNGDPGDHEPDHATRRRAFNGLCMALIRATDQPGPATLQATAPGLAPGVVRLNVGSAEDGMR
jgi:beta-galactosidase